MNKKKRKKKEKMADVRFGEIIDLPNGDRLMEITGMPGRPHRVRDWRAALTAKHTTRKKSSLGAVDVGRMKSHYLANKPLIMESIEANRNRRMPEWENQPVIICGGGPSLAKNAHHLENLAPGAAKIIAINSGLRMAPNADVFVSNDWLGDASWTRGVDVTKIDAIFFACSAHDVVKLPWKSRVFFSFGHSNELYDRINAEYPKLLKLDPGLHGAFNAFQLAFWQLADPIAFCGMDYSWGADERLHAAPHDHEVGISLRDAGAGTWSEITDMSGEKRHTNFVTYLNCMYMRAAAFFVAEAGVKVYNATEGGIFDLNGSIIQRKLKGVVHEYNLMSAAGTRPATQSNSH